MTPGVRVVLDARPLQAPDRAPVTAAYLDALLAAYDAEPLAGESFAFLLQSDLDDPTERFSHLTVVGRRMLPPTRLLRSGALTIDPFLLGGASLGAAWRAERHGAAGAVYHAVGGAVPLFSRIPTVVSLLDLAAWELPHAFQRGATVRFGQRLRAQLLRDAAAIIVGTDAVAGAARRLLRIRRDRIHVVRLAPRDEFRAAAARNAGAAADGSAGRWSEGTGEDHRAERERLGLPARYFVYSGRYDARHDLATLVAGARAALMPVVSEAAGLPAIEALAAGTPVVASAVGALPELVGPAGILVEPRDAGRLGVALATIWADDRVHRGLAAAAREHSETDRRTWLDVARETRAVYAAAGVPRSERAA